MMKTVLIRQHDIADALQKAATFDIANDAGIHLNTANDNDILGRISEIWDFIDHVIRNAYDNGMDSIKEQIQNCHENIQQILDQTGQKAVEVTEAVRVKIQTYIDALVDSALRKVNREIVVGDKTMHMVKVSLSHTIAFGGGLKASLENVCELSAQGTMNLIVEYE